MSEMLASHSSARHSGVRSVLIVDDHPAFRLGLSGLIAAEKDLFVCGEAATGRDALHAAQNLRPDAIVLDVGLPDGSGIEFAKSLRKAYPAAAILIVSLHEESRYALLALQAGASGYITKLEAADHILNGLRDVLQGRVYLSPHFNQRLIFQVLKAGLNGEISPLEILTKREQEVLALLGEGLGTSDTARQLKVSAKTVETHRTHLREKLRFRDSSEMLQFASDWAIQRKKGAASPEA